MGICYCHNDQSSHEILVDEIFLSLPIRNKSIDEVLSEFFRETIPITETSFQIICNKLCINNEWKKNLSDYWVRVFKNTTKKKSTILVFTLSLLSKKDSTKSNVDKFIELFSNFYDGSSATTETEDVNFSDSICNLKNKKKIKIVENELRDILYGYFYAISYLTIDNFAEISRSKDNFKDYLNSLWTPGKIFQYTTKKFFGKSKNLFDRIDIRRFLLKNIDFLSNDSLIRKEIANFEYKEVKEGEEYLDFKKISEKNY